MLTFMGFMMPRDGYGYATIKIAEALERLAPVQVVDMRDDTGMFGKVGDRLWDVREADVAVALCVPDWLEMIQSQRLVAHTMFEATRLPDGWAEAINERAASCMVPCEWCRETFRENGVRVPLEVVRWGVDPADYWELEREERDGPWPYTFLWSGTPDRRKGWDVAYRAFWHAFGGSRDVRLTMHFRQKPRGVAGFSDGNVEMVVGLFGRPRLREMLRPVDCFLFPSRGEGWGLPPREAAATGLPVIATNFGGLAEEIEEWAMPLRVAGTSKAAYGFWDDVGEWCEPDVDHLVALMRWCFENREEAAAFGGRAATWLAENGTWERTARRIIDLAVG